MMAVLLQARSLGHFTNFKRDLHLLTWPTTFFAKYCVILKYKIGIELCTLIISYSIKYCYLFYQALLEIEAIHLAASP